MYIYPYYNLAFWLLLIILLLLRLSTYQFVPKLYFEANKVAVRGYILRHPYEQSGFQIIEVGEYKFKTNLNYKYYLGQYLEIYFDKNYLNRKLIYSPQIKIIPHMTYSVITVFANFRDFLIKRVFSDMHQPYSGLLLGMVVGYKQDFPSDIENMLIKVGIVHIVVFSGANVSFFTDLIFPIFRRIGFLGYILLSSFVFTLILFFVGFEIPVLRAITMGLLKSIAFICGVDVDPFILVFYTLIITLFVYPPLINSLSFYLSFGATISLLLAEDWAGWFKSPFNVLISNAVASILLMPLLGFYFGSISFVGFIMNILVGLVSPFVMKIGLAYLFLPNIVCKFFLLALLEYIFIIIALFDNFEIAQKSISVQPWLLSAIYLPVFSAYLIWKMFYKELSIKYE